MNCKDCNVELPSWHAMKYCKPCFGRRVSKGQGRGSQRARPLEGVDIDAIHRNPRWKKAPA